MNGWTNWETWHIVAWIDNDESLNRIMHIQKNSIQIKI